MNNQSDTTFSREESALFVCLAKIPAKTSLHAFVDRLREEKSSPYQTPSPEPSLEKMLHKLVIASRVKANDEFSFGQVASVALSILNLSGVVSFAGMDLHDIKVPGADLTGAVLHNTNLNGAKLQGARLAGAFLAGADLRGAELEGVEFGTEPFSVFARPDSYSSNFKLKMDTNVKATSSSVAFLTNDTISTCNLKTRELGVSAKAKAMTFSWNTKSGVAAAAGRTCIWFYECVPNKTWKRKGKITRFKPKTNDYILQVEFNPRGTLLASIHRDGSIRIWKRREGGWVSEVLSGRETNQISERHNFSWSPDGKKFASSDSDKVRIWEVAEGAVVDWQELQSIEGAGRPFGKELKAIALAWSPSSQFVATPLVNGSIEVFGVSKGQRDQFPQTLHHESKAARSPGEINCIAWNPNPATPLFAAGTSRGEVFIWQKTPEKWKHVAILSDAGGQRRMSLAWKNDGAQLLYGTTGVWGSPKNIYFWDAKTGRREVDPQGHLGAVVGLSFNGDGALLASVSEDRSTRIWNTDTGAEVGVLEEENRNAEVVSWKQHQLVVGGWKSALRIWTQPKRKEDVDDPLLWKKFLLDKDNPLLWQKTLFGKDPYIRRAEFTPDGKRLATIGSEVRIWNTTDWKSLVLHPSWRDWDFARSLSWNHDGTALVMGGERGRLESWDLDINLWNLKDGSQWEEEDSDFNSKNMPVKLDVHEYKEDWHLTRCLSETDFKSNVLQMKRRRQVLDVSWCSKDTLAVAQPDRLTVLWERKMESSTSIEPLQHGRGLVWILDGKGLVAGGRDGVIRWWAVDHEKRTLGLVSVIGRHKSPVTSVCWSEEGEKLATSSRDGVIHTYLFRPEKQDFILRWRSGHKFLNLRGLQFSGPSLSPLNRLLLEQNKL